MEAQILFYCVMGTVAWLTQILMKIHSSVIPFSRTGTFSTPIQQPATVAMDIVCYVDMLCYGVVKLPFPPFLIGSTTVGAVLCICQLLYFLRSSAQNLELRTKALMGIGPLIHVVLVFLFALNMVTKDYYSLSMASLRLLLKYYFSVAALLMTPLTILVSLYQLVYDDGDRRILFIRTSLGIFSSIMGLQVAKHARDHNLMAISVILSVGGFLYLVVAGIKIWRDRRAPAEAAGQPVGGH